MEKLQLLSPLIVIFVSFSGQGGVERMMCNLAQGLLDAGYRVDMVVVKAKGEHMRHIPSQVRVFQVRARHTLTSVWELAAYLKREQPQVLLAAKERAIKTAVWARLLSGTRQCRLVGRLGTHLSAALAAQGWNKVAQWWRYRRMAQVFTQVDALICVSHGVAGDIQRITGLPADRIHAIHNPVVTPRIFALAQEPLLHPWFVNTDVPVVLAAGRLTTQKDFVTLLQAFATMRQRLPARLVILGEGEMREELQSLARGLGIWDHVLFAGFVANPYAYMAKAQLFVLSSRWEGSPNVLTEAVALGVPVVATDCPSGPREILQQGRFGTLVPMADVVAMATAMEQTLRAPLAREILQQAAQPYLLANSTDEYLRVFGLK